MVAELIETFFTDWKVLASRCGLVSPPDVYKRQIIDQVRRFDVRGKRVFETNEKYYFEDIGLRNVLVGSCLLYTSRCV